jgi:UV DNA damage endonuclease
MHVISAPEQSPRICLGLCCINNSLRKHDIFCSRTVISRLYTKDKADALTKKNLEDLCTLIDWNSKNNINVFRMSSDMFPRITDGEIDRKDRVCVSDYADYLQKAGELVKRTGQRITMHPGQYNQVGALDSSVFERTSEDLQNHAEIMDVMGIDENGILTVHGGGVYGDKETTTRRWIEQFSDLPRSVKNRLCIENCERQYNIEDCLHIAEECKIPVIFDSHHFDCYNQIHGTSFVADDYVVPVLETWGSRRMVAHISEQKIGSRIGAHSDFIEKIPEYLLSIPRDLELSIDIEVEAKAKEEAIKYLSDKYCLC